VRRRAGKLPSGEMKRNNSSKLNFPSITHFFFYLENKTLNRRNGHEINYSQAWKEMFSLFNLLNTTTKKLG
jgi:hypothetical protein